MISELKKSEFQELEKVFPEVFAKFGIKSQIENNIFRKFYTISVGKKIIGFISFDIIYERAELIDIYVDSKFQNNGYGSMLLSYFIDYCRSNKILSITLEVRVDNVNAICLYKKFGFNPVSLRKGYYDGIDGILMERKMM